MAFHTFDEFDQLEDFQALDTNLTLRQIWESVPNQSLLAGYMDDFLPGERNEFLRGRLYGEPNGWRLEIYVPIMSDTGVHRFTKTGAPVRNY